ncbi:hypothetical protein HNR62_000502 [Oceanisphaera litoralis]|uniref:hypothetical protein n=1 Tax=Oceanisphaera litoralis TaxID=225144 RepID=UPI00195A6958|nr:hypothetical protein [Oceanisphaera litoralis]MBM7454673.1 hypothetical protein [Oceanisphaera litoralis]
MEQDCGQERVYGKYKLCNVCYHQPGQRSIADLLCITIMLKAVNKKKSEMALSAPFTMMVQASAQMSKTFGAMTAQVTRHLEAG